MSPAMILQHLDEIANENQSAPVKCCWCNNRVNIIKYGKYQRYNFVGDQLIDIQRYLCKHDGCRRTFSILPHPFLRILRFSLCMFFEILRLIARQVSKAEVARRFNMNWPTIARSIEKGQEILDWIHQELKAEPDWFPFPCIRARTSWSDFIRMFAAKFYPKRYGFLDQQNMYI